MTAMHPGPSGPHPAYAPIAPLDVVGFLRAAWRGRWLLALCMTGAVLLGGYYAFHMTSPRYGANAQLHLTETPDTTRRNTQLAGLTDRNFLAQIVRDQELLNDPEFNRYLQPPSPLSPIAIRSRLRHFLAGTTPMQPDTAAVLEKTIANLRAALQVAQIPDTHIVEIRTHSGNATKAITLSNAIATGFASHQRDLAIGQLQTTESLLSDQAATARADLTRHQGAITTLIANAQIRDSGALDQLNRQVLTAAEAVSGAELSLAALQQATPTRNARQTAVAEQEALVASLTRQHDRLQRQLAAQSAGFAQLQHLQREADAAKLLSDTLLVQLQEVRMRLQTAATEGATVALATTADYLGPRKLWIMEGAALLGFIAGLGLIAMRQATRHGMRDQTELEQATGLPVLVQSPPRMMKEGPILRHALVNSRAGPLAGTLHRLRTRLMLAHGGQIKRVILCTSASGDEGAAAHALALATLLAQSGKRVLLVRAGASARDRKRPGMVDIMNGDAKLSGARRRDKRLGLDMLTRGGGKGLAEPAVIPGFDVALQRIGAPYDHVVISASPVLDDPAALLWARQADAVLYAARWDSTPLPVVRRALAELAAADAALTGLLLTGVPRHILQQTPGKAFAQAQPAPATHLA